MCKILMLITLQILLFPLPGFTKVFEKNTVFEDVLIIAKNLPFVQSISSNWLTYNPISKTWNADQINGTGKKYIQGYPIDQWDVYIEDGVLSPQADGTIILIQTEMDYWGGKSSECPYGDAVVAPKHQSLPNLNREVSCVNWDQEKQAWAVIYVNTNHNRKEYLNPKKYDIFTFNGRLEVKDNQVTVIPTYKER